MPELPEVEVLVRHLDPLLRGKQIRGVAVGRAKIVRPETSATLADRLVGATFGATTRRGKNLLFGLRHGTCTEPFSLVGHLGMTGRMFLQPAAAPLPKHTAVSLDLGEQRFVFEDPRCFGRFHLDLAPLAELGPEPLSDDFTVDAFSVALECSSQAVKVKLLDQSLVAGIGNIYASEALFRAGISPLRGARSLRRDEIGRLRDRIREVLADAIRLGGSVPLDWSGEGKGDALFYYGAKETGPATGSAEERFAVYGREGEPCTRCAGKVVRCVQAARSTFHCPGCQPG